MESNQKIAVFFSDAPKNRKVGAIFSWLAAVALIVALFVPTFQVDLGIQKPLDASEKEQMIQELPEKMRGVGFLLLGTPDSILTFLTRNDAQLAALKNAQTDSSAAYGGWVGIVMLVLLGVFILANVMFALYTMNLLSLAATFCAILEIILIYIFRFRSSFTAVLDKEAMEMLGSLLGSLSDKVSFPLHIAIILALSAAALFQIVGVILHYALREEGNNNVVEWDDDDGRNAETGLVDDNISRDNETVPLTQNPGPASVATLIQLNTGKSFPIRNNSQLVLGKGSQADIVIPNPMISRMHACIRCVNSTCTIEDLNSKNGTFVGDQRLPSGTSVILTNEMYITLGNEIFQFKG